MTRQQKREYVLDTFAIDCRALERNGADWLIKRKRAALTALAQIDAGKRWRDVLKEFER